MVRAENICPEGIESPSEDFITPKMASVRVEQVPCGSYQSNVGRIWVKLINHIQSSFASLTQLHTQKSAHYSGWFSSNQKKFLIF